MHTRPPDPPSPHPSHARARFFPSAPRQLKDQITKWLESDDVKKYVCDKANYAKATTSEGKGKALCTKFATQADDMTPVQALLVKSVTGGTMLLNALKSPEVCKQVMECTGTSLKTTIEKCNTWNTGWGKKISSWL